MTTWLPALVVTWRGVAAPVVAQPATASADSAGIASLLQSLEKVVTAGHAAAYVQLLSATVDRA